MVGRGNGASSAFRAWWVRPRAAWELSSEGPVCRKGQWAKAWVVSSKSSLYSLDKSTSVGWSSWFGASVSLSENPPWGSMCLCSSFSLLWVPLVRQALESCIRLSKATTGNCMVRWTQCWTQCSPGSLSGWPSHSFSLGWGWLVFKWVSWNRWWRSNSAYFIEGVVRIKWDNERKSFGTIPGTQLKYPINGNW